MKNTEMIPMKEVLELVHLKLGYGKDDFSQEVFGVLNEGGNEHYLIDGRNMRLYINKYIERKYQELHGSSLTFNYEADTIIKIEGTTQKMRYCKHGILKMLEDEHVKRLLLNRFKKRSTYFGRMPIASELSRYEMAKANGIITDKDQVSFFETIKNDSLDEMKEKLNVLQKSIEVNEMIKQTNEEEAEETVKDLEEMESIKQHINETMKQIETEVLELEKELEWEKIFEETLQLEIELEKNYCYLSSNERIELESKCEALT